ncbi:MAG TPA: hypothetical protein IGS53_21765 [Leptolyngbyaceae cyanobacterium M33_DOE_097]|uniref:Alpha/beta hydrolase n=1 Tax=Oscillatoriales cyanobacterium SpSt-418 TaxID=2282169 RepID=A0A7C3KHS1_9CYAN|nr:hypothetical protein [Leptolyngbyaceae cyanobacterium M33_DOE_097]
MLVWFMHGASVRRVEYADPLRSRLIQLFSSSGTPIPEFYSSFWGDSLGNTDQMWDWVQQDLEAFRWDHPQIDLDDIFHYRQRRQQLITGFFSDIFTYLNSKKGREVRKVIAVQFLNFLTSSATFDDDLHIVAHSLGAVILWDILFSDKYDSSDPAYYIRHTIRGLNPSGKGKVALRSITTMGSPLLFFNQWLDVDDEHLKKFARQYVGKPLRWINIINASDVFAYPIRASLEIEEDNLYVRDQYLGDRNFLKKGLGDVTMALGLVSDHSSYWRSGRVAQLVAANLLGDYTTLENVSRILEFGEVD